MFHLEKKFWDALQTFFTHFWGLWRLFGTTVNKSDMLNRYYMNNKKYNLADRDGNDSTTLKSIT